MNFFSTAGSHREQITMWSDAVGRYTMNSDKALTFDIKMTFEKKSALPTVSWTTLGTPSMGVN